MTITRADQYSFLEGIVKQAFSIERISNGVKKEDPFEGKVDGNVWKIVGKKLIRKRIKNG